MQNDLSWTNIDANITDIPYGWLGVLLFYSGDKQSKIQQYLDLHGHGHFGR